MVICMYMLAWFLFSNPYNDIGRYYEGNGSNVYYLNNFDSLSQSYGESFANDNRYTCLHCTCVFQYNKTQIH